MRSKAMVDCFLIAFLMSSLVFIRAGFEITRLGGTDCLKTPTLQFVQAGKTTPSNPVPAVMNEQQETQIAIDPIQKGALVGQTFTVNVDVSNVINMYGYEFKLAWNYSVVELKSAIRPPGHFMEPVLDPGDYFVGIWKLNESRAGGLQTAHFGYTLIAPEPAKNGSGILVTLTYRALAIGSTLLDLNNTKLADNTAGPIVHSDVDGLVNVNPPLSVSILPSSVVLDVGQVQLFTSSVLGGVFPYGYQWYLNNTSVSGATNSTWTFSPSSAATFKVYLNVTDDSGSNATSNQATVTVNNPPSVTISPTSVTLDIDQYQQFVSAVSGGTSPFSYQWYLNEVPVSGATGATWTFAPSSTGFYDVYANITDGVNAIAISNVATVTVNSAVSVTISPTLVSMKTGESQPFTSSVTDGTPPYTYQWCLNDTLAPGATSPTWSFTPTTAGTYYVTLNVTDSVSGTAQSDPAIATVVTSVHDIALTGIENSKSGCKPISTIGQNVTLQINVTAYNFGDSPESFDVILYANTTEIQRISVTGLAPGSAIVLTFDWSTIGFAKGGYVVSAYAEPVSGETNTANNSILGEPVSVVIPGDINGDGVVDIFDIARVAVVFGMKYPHTSWDPNADINDDGVIDIFDIAAVAVHFSETG